MLHSIIQRIIDHVSHKKFHTVELSSHLCPTRPQAVLNPPPLQFDRRSSASSPALEDPRSDACGALIELSSLFGIRPIASQLPIQAKIRFSTDGNALEPIVRIANRSCESFKPAWNSSDSD